MRADCNYLWACHAFKMLSEVLRFPPGVREKQPFPERQCQRQLAGVHLPGLPEALQQRGAPHAWYGHINSHSFI